MRTRLRRLIPRHAAAHRVEIEPRLLRRLNGNAQIFSQERWDLDPSFFYVQNDSTPRWQALSIGANLRR